MPRSSKLVALAALLWAAIVAPLWAQTIGPAPPGSSTAANVTVGTSAITGGTTGRVLYDNAGALGEYTAAQLTAQINAATATLSGALPAFPNNTTTFFRGDGAYAALNLAAFPTQAANTVLGNATAGAAVPTALALSSCSAATTSALIYTSNTGFGCRTDFTTVATAAVGQVPGTTTNDSATAGSVGEVIQACGNAASATVTITIASPAVVSDAGAACGSTTAQNAVGVGSVIRFTTTGALPTGITQSTSYYIIPAGFSAGVSYQISATPFGAAINTSGTQSGVQTRAGAVVIANGAYQDVAVVSLTAGDWDCSAGALISSSGVTTALGAQFSTASNTSNGSNPLGQNYQTVSITGDTIVLPVGRVRYLLASTTTVFLDATAAFSTGSSTGSGAIQCRRMR